MNKYEGFIGKVLDGRYKILELVGLGGMACVLKAQDLVMNRVVAIKILNDEYNGNEAAEARFIDESKAVAMLSNKNIVGVYDVAIYPDIKYIVMEYLDGITMREYLDNKGAIGWKEACIYILQILRALEHAHSKGIIHRDIKPQNVMLMKNGDIKVTDFGIAKLPDSATDNPDEKAVGTVYYISPEQACGKQTDYYSDIYSVGIMFYEAVTGTLPFVAETPMEIAMMQVNDEPVHPRDIVLDIPVGVSQIILKAIEKSPDERFRSAHTMAKAIEWVLRYPDVIFSMNSVSAEDNPAGNNSVVSIDMISTAELEPYGDEEIAESLGTTKKQPAPKNTKTVKRKKSKRSTSMFPMVLGVSLAFFLVLVGVIIKVIGTISQQSDANEGDYTVEFPDLVGDVFSNELVNELRNGTYKFEISADCIIYEYNNDLPNNYIISTEPKGGEVRKCEKGDILQFEKVVINRYESVEIPDVLSLTKNSARNILVNLGLKVEFVESNEADNPYFGANQVLSVYPEVGETIKIGETVTVTVYVPASEYTAKMPDLTGLTADEALKHAQTYAGYTVQFEEVVANESNAAIPLDRVCGQSVTVGSVNTKGTMVTVYIKVAPKTFIMPDLKNKTTAEVNAIFAELSPETTMDIAAEYYVIETEELVNFFLDSQSCATYDDYLYLIKEFMVAGIAKALPSDDGQCTLFYQSVPVNTELLKENVAVGSDPASHIQIKLIYIGTYTREWPGANNSTSTPVVDNGSNTETVVTP